MPLLDSVALAKSLGLRPKSKATLDELIANPKISQVDAYLKHHKTTSRPTARAHAARLTAKDNSKIYTAAHVGIAKKNIVHMASDNSVQPATRLKANQDILDRNEGKPTIKTISTTRNLNINIEASEQLKSQFTEFLKQKTQSWAILSHSKPFSILTWALLSSFQVNGMSWNTYCTTRPQGVKL